MEKARHRRSRSATSVEGNFQGPQQKAVQSLVSDSHSYCDGISKDDLLTSHFTQNAVKRGSGMPIKKLLAEEMAKEGEAKRRSPNVIARLMGLDGLPSPQYGQRQQKKLFDKHQQRNASRNIQQNEHLYEDQLSRRSSVDQKDFKDVYEDLEASHVTNCRHSSKWSMNSGLTKPEMKLVQQKFVDAKRLSYDAEPQVSKECDDTLEMLDSNKDLLLRYLQQPDSLFSRPLHDLQVASSRSCYDRTAAIETADSRSKGWKSERDNACKCNISSHPKREDGLLLKSHSHCSSQGPCNPLRNHLHVENEPNVLPTRIVVLKPNIGKSSNSISSVSSPESSHIHPSPYRKNLEHRTAKSHEVASQRTKTISSRGISSSPKSREERAFAREVTRRMRENCESFGGGFNILTHSGTRGYAGDESSYDAYESDSSSELEGKTMSPNNGFDWNNWYTRSSSGPNESLVSKEAKKRMSERWKMTHRYQDVESLGKGSTLGEMLAVPDRETRHETLGSATTLDGDNRNFPCRKNYSGCDSPLGISSRDGWKDGCLKNSSRSRSITPSLFSSRSHRLDGRYEALVIPNETKHLRRSKARKGILSQKEDYSSGDKSSSSRKPHLCSDDANSSPDVNASLLQADISLDKEDQQEEDTMLSQVPAASGSCSTSVSDMVPDAKHESLTLSVDTPVDFERSDNMAENYNSNAPQETMWKQEPGSQSDGAPSHIPCPGPEPESSESSKEADHPSPVSVLEVSFVEDVSSSSDCFGRVNAELHELRMQLQLLKMESGGYADTPVLTSSLEPGLQQSEIVPEEGYLLGGQSWESCYIDEVLFNAGLEEFSPDTTFVATWHSPECPLDPWIFDNLEKNHAGETTRLKFERKLLFDRINLALLQMFKHHTNPCPWVKPMRGALTLNWQKCGVKDALHSFLANQETEVNGENAQKLLDREMYWLEFRDDIDIVGKEIEKMLIHDLIGEILTM